MARHAFSSAYTDSYSISSACCFTGLLWVVVVPEFASELDGSLADTRGAGDAGDAAGFVGVALDIRLGVCTAVVNGLTLRGSRVRLDIKLS